MDQSISPLEKKRLKFKPIVPKVLQNLNLIRFQKEQKTEAVGDKKEIEKHFPKHMDVPLSMQPWVRVS